MVELQERVAFLERDIKTLDGVVRELAGGLDAEEPGAGRASDADPGRASPRTGGGLPVVRGTGTGATEIAVHAA